MPRVQSQKILELMSSGKYRTRRDRNAKVECASMHIERIHRGCAFDPEKVTAARRGNAITGGKVPSQGWQRGVLRSGQAAAQPCQVRIVAAMAQHLGDSLLHG